MRRDTSWFTVPIFKELLIMHFLFVALFALFMASGAVAAQSVPAPIYTDPPMDAAHPAGMDVLHIPSHGLVINGVMYRPSGAGTHPTLVICHGLPGNEKNLDLAQAVRRAGWNAVTFNYRGSWGSSGTYRFAQNLEDADSVLAFLSDPVNAAKLEIDTKRMAIAGHSMGGWVTAHTAARHHNLIAAILISAADMGSMGGMPRDKLIAEMADNMEGLSGVTPQIMADELTSNARDFGFANTVAGLTEMPLLVLSAEDGLAPQTDSLVKAIRSNRGQNVTAIHVTTDHSWSDHRIFLESTIIDWLAKLK
jgi:uncharacterized protein